MSEQVLLVVNTSKFLMNAEEAFEIASALNGCNVVGTKWAKGGSLTIVDKPNPEASYIVPITAHMQLEWDANKKEVEK